MLERAGLTPVRVELIPVDMVHENRQELEGWIRTTWLPFLERLPASRKEDFVTDLTDHNLASHPPDCQGRTCVKMVRLVVEGRKRGGDVNYWLSPDVEGERGNLKFIFMPQGHPAA